MSRTLILASGVGLSFGLGVNTFLASVSPDLTVSAVLSLLTVYWYYPIYVALALVAFNFYYRIFIKQLEGYYPLTEQEKEKMKNRPYPKDMPQPFPTSWFKLMNSHELRIGESKAITFFETELVIFRASGDKTGDGRGIVHVMDAYCPHLGANLGVGGKVVGNCIQCPFHGWCFDGSTGQCSSIPYSDKSPPESAKVHSWPVCEVNHQIFIWYDSQKRSPTWQIPEISKVSGWKFHGEVVHELSCHCQEIPENGADVAHLAFLHGPFLLPFLKCFTHMWDASYQTAPEPNTHLATLTLKTCLGIFGRPVEFTRVNANILQIGPGIVHMQFPTIFGQVCNIETITPVGRFQQRATNLVLAETWVPRFVAKFFLKSIQVQFERDIPIWNAKKFVRAPMQVKGDGPLLQFRRWYKQFYQDKIYLMNQEAALAAEKAAALPSASSSSTAASTPPEVEKPAVKSITAADEGKDKSEKTSKSLEW